jgi:hypothetical protein
MHTDLGAPHLLKNIAHLYLYTIAGTLTRRMAPPHYLLHLLAVCLYYHQHARWPS